MNKLIIWTIAFVAVVTLLVASTVVFTTTNSDDTKQVCTMIIFPLCGVSLIVLGVTGLDE
jgi:hypothetical protein